MVLADGLAGHRDAVGVHVATFDQRLDDDRHTADLEQVLGHVLPAGLEVGDVGRVAEDVADIVQVEVDATLVGNGRQVQAGVGRTTGRRDNAGRVLQRLAGHDVTRAQVQPDQVHYRLARLVGVGVADLVRRRCTRRMRQGEADGL